MENDRNLFPADAGSQDSDSGQPVSAQKNIPSCKIFFITSHCNSAKWTFSTEKSRYSCQNMYGKVYFLKDDHDLNVVFGKKCILNIW